jgi:PAP2 superfamily
MGQPKLILPPYGQINRDLLELVLNGRPGDWCEPTNESKKLRTWQVKLKRNLQDEIWPAYVRGDWVGGAKKTASALLTEELKFMKRFRNLIDGYVDTEAHAFIKHISLFQNEDLHIGEKLDIYDEKVATWFDQYRGKQTRTEWFDEECEKNYIAPILHFKILFQRPRPYQCSMTLPFRDFVQEPSASFTTPSFPSGHCFQAIMMMLELYRRLQKAPATKHASGLGLARYAAHVGDRRVMAGLHFPTDNIASWYLAFELTKALYPDSEVLLKFVQNAVKESLVFKRLESYNKKMYPQLSARFAWVVKALELPSAVPK